IIINRRLTFLPLQDLLTFADANCNFALPGRRGVRPGNSWMPATCPWRICQRTSGIAKREWRPPCGLLAANGHRRLWVEAILLRLRRSLSEPDVTRAPGRFCCSNP